MPRYKVFKTKFSYRTDHRHKERVDGLLEKGMRKCYEDKLRILNEMFHRETQNGD